MILGAASEGDILVAVFSAATAAFTIAIPAFLRARKTDRKVERVNTSVEDHANEIKETLGTKNGHGDLVQMLTQSLENQGFLIHWTQDHDAQDERRFGQVAVDIKQLIDRVNAIEEDRQEERRNENPADESV